MRKSPFKIKKGQEMKRKLIDKAYIVSVDDSFEIDIKALKRKAIILLPTQLPELMNDKDVIDDFLAEEIMIALKQR